MSYQESLERIGAVTSAAVLARYAELSAAKITAQQFKDMAGVVIMLAGQQGRMIAELAFTSWLQSLGKAPYTVGAAPIEHYRDPARLNMALDTILAGPDEQIEHRLERLAFSESVESSQQTFGRVMDEDGTAAGWTRGLDADPCQLCVWWWREGRVWRTGHDMPTHTGCTCSQVPVTELNADGNNQKD